MFFRDKLKNNRNSKFCRLNYLELLGLCVLGHFSL